VENLFHDFKNSNPGLFDSLKSLGYFSLILLLCIVLYFISKFILLKIIKHAADRSKSRIYTAFIENGVIGKLLFLIPAFVVPEFSFLFSEYKTIIHKLTVIYIILICISVVNSLLNSLMSVVKSNEGLKNKPVKGYFDFMKIMTYLIGGVLVISLIIDKSPVVFLSGIGALMAIILLIFKDTLLGLTGSIQIASNNIVNVGDWIEIPGANIDGEVTDISLLFLKLKSADNSIVNIPVYSFVSNIFKNWKGIDLYGARRIKRSITVDINSIKYCNQKLINDIEKKYEYKPDLTEDLTNMTYFRLYIDHFIKNNPGINQTFSILIRSLQPTEKGLPVEIYAFSNETDWKKNEEFQSQLIEKFIVILKDFDLKIYQNNSGIN
jgi:miniconductance mechanosensitive channel